MADLAPSVPVPADPLSSLAYNAITLPPAPSPGCARREGVALLCIETGELFPVRCRANFCPSCGPNNARLIGGAVTLAQPERWGLITQVGDDWQTIRGRMFRLRYELSRALSQDFDWCWHIEPNPKGTGHHAHYWQRGAFVPQRLLSAAADGVGLGRFATIKKWRPTAKATVYGVKLAGVRYGLKAAEAEDSMQEYLEANGKRLVHSSRGFWKDRSGASVTQREAMASWAKRPDASEATWRIVYLAKRPAA